MEKLEKRCSYNQGTHWCPCDKYHSHDTQVLDCPVYHTSVFSMFPNAKEYLRYNEPVSGSKVD
jgi:hypothetical protein